MKMEVCECLFLDNVQAQAEARTLGLLVVVLKNWDQFTAAKWADYKPSGAQSKNPTIHTYQQTRNICMEQQETVKEQCDK